VHDDTIDQSTVRRGAATVNATWNGHVAILVGDYLFAQAALMAAGLGDLQAMALLAETIKDLCRGEVLQLESGFAWDQSEELYYEKIRCKTASLLALCTEGAAVLCGAPPHQVAALRAYGIALGQAFQIVDDILDITGDEETIGKPAGSDLRHGTVTLPVIYYLRDLGPDDGRRAVMTGGDAIDEALALLRTSPALDEARRRARVFVAQAKAALAVFAVSPAREALLELADRVISRNS
jgi:geranylgeranyl pyrophosphate synthase